MALAPHLFLLIMLIVAPHLLTMGVHRGLGDELDHRVDAETEVLSGQVACPDVRAALPKWGMINVKLTVQASGHMVMSYDLLGWVN